MPESYRMPATKLRSSLCQTEKTYEYSNYSCFFAAASLASALKILQSRRNKRVCVGDSVLIKALDTGEEAWLKLENKVENPQVGGFISIQSPLGNALTGRAPGDIFTVQLLGSKAVFMVLKVRP